MTISSILLVKFITSSFCDFFKISNCSIISAIITSVSLLTYCLTKAYSFFTSVNGYYNFFDTLVDMQKYGHIFSGGLIFILNACVGLVVSCTMYGFYSLFKRGEI